MSITAYHGDCLEVMKNLPDKSVDLFICDLPYGCLSRSSIGKAAEEKKVFSGNPTGCAWDVPLNLEEFWKQVKRLAKNDNTPVLHFCTTKFGSELINSKPSWFRYDLVWDKQRGVSFLTANKMPMRSHEMVYVFSKSGAYYNRVDIKGDFPAVKAWGKDETTGVYNFTGRTTEAAEGRRCVKSVIPMLNFGKKNRHPTEKPIELYKWLIERYCPAGGTVLDPTAGSFNSCLAGFELDRHCIGIEKDADFYKKAAEKLDKLT